NYIKSKISPSKNPIVLFDVGANIGQYAVELGNIFNGTQYVIHSFEPSQKTFQILLNTISKSQNIIPNNIGLGESEQTLMLFANSDSSQLASVYQRNLDHYSISMSHKEEVKITTVDTYSQTHEINHIHFLKLDIEGHELSAIKGAKTMIENGNIQFIQFEFGGCNIDSRTYFQDFWYLLKDRYHFYRIVKDGLVPITKYNESLEVFKTINFLLELK
ncbi:MAG: FkbM family methyltransferase, partial [Cytophagales bacterium]|nr:FkbM family methyltransferase [Cytophagales bacterium]